MSEFEELSAIAETCVQMVRGDFGRDLDYSVASLHVLDLVCGELYETGWHDQEQAEQWWQAVGCYFGEVLLRAHGGAWVEHEGDGGPYAVRIGTSIAFPFEAAAQVLTGTPGARLATFADEAPSAPG